MVQILPAAQPKRSFGGEFGRMLGGGLSEGVQQGMETKRKMAQMSQENKAIADKFGIDLSGVTSPDERKVILQQALMGQNKENLLGQKQGFLNKIFGNTEKDQTQTRVQSNDIGKEGFKENTSDKRFDPLEISDSDIAQATSIDPNLGRELRYAKDSARRERQQQEKMSLAKEKINPEHQREQRLSTAQAEADVKYNQSLQEASKQHELKEQTLNRLEKLNLKGVTGKPYEKLLEKFGLVGLTTEGRREFAADVKNLITDIRSILGGQFSAFEFQTILNAYPSADFSKDANSAIIRNLKDFQDIKKKEVEFANDLKRENGGKIPFDMQSQVNERVREYAAGKLPQIKANTQKILAEEYGITKGNILMLDPNGEPLDVSPNQVEYYQSLGATLP